MIYLMIKLNGQSSPSPNQIVCEVNAASSGILVLLAMAMLEQIYCGTRISTTHVK